MRAAAKQLGSLHGASQWWQMILIGRQYLEMSGGEGLGSGSWACSRPRSISLYGCHMKSPGPGTLSQDMRNDGIWRGFHKCVLLCRDTSLFLLPVSVPSRRAPLCMLFRLYALAFAPRDSETFHKASLQLALCLKCHHTKPSAHSTQRKWSFSSNSC